MSSRACQGYGPGEVSRLVEWFPRAVIYGSVLVNLLLIAVLAGLYAAGGQKEILLAILFLAATTPIDILVLRGMMLENARILGRAVVEAITGLGPQRFTATRRGTRVYIAARLDHGDLHTILSPGRIEAALVESPTYLPPPQGRGLAKTLIHVPPCGQARDEAEIETVLPDPESGCPRLLKGRARLAGYRCNSLDPGKVRDLLGGLVRR